MQAAGARASQVLAGAPLDNGNVDSHQRQLARQHQPGRTSSGDHHRMLSHRHTPAVPHAGDQLGRAQLARRQQLTHLVTRRFWFQTRRPVLPAAQVSPRLGNHACPPGYCPIKEDLGAVVTPAGFRQAAAVRSRLPDRRILTLNCPCGGAALSFIDLELRVRLGLAETLAPAIRSTLHNFPQSCKAN